MSATVVSIFDYFRRLTPAQTQSPEQQARLQVTEQLQHRVGNSVMCQARARAVRTIIGGRPVAEAVRRAVAWALSADHGDDDTPRAA